MHSAPVSQALSRLSAAIDRLEAAALRHREGERMRKALETELALMREDRRQLADILDETLAEGRALYADVTALGPRIAELQARVGTGAE